MRILIINEGLFNNFAGTRIARGAGKILAQGGDEVAFFSQESWPEFEDKRWSFRVYPAPRSSCFRYIYDQTQARAAARAIEDFQPDVVHAVILGNVGGLSWTVIQAAHRLRVPVVFAPVAYLPMCMNTYFYRPGSGECHLCQRHRYRFGVSHLCGGRIGSFTQWLAMHLQKETLKHVAVWLSTCEAFDRAILDYGIPPERIVRTYHPFDWSRVKGVPIENGPSFVFHAQGRMAKGIHLFPEIFSKVMDCTFELYLWSVQWPHLDRLVSRQNKVSIYTDLRWETGVCSALSQARAAVLPTVNPSFGEFAVYESMALGKPVIAFEVGANPLLVKHKETGYLAPKDDVQELAEAVMLLRDDRKLAGDMGHAAKERAKALFAPEVIYQIYLRAFNRAINGTHAGSR